MRSSLALRDSLLEIIALHSIIVPDADDNTLNPTNAEVEDMRPIWFSNLGRSFEAGASDTANVVSNFPTQVDDIDWVDHEPHRGIEQRQRFGASATGWSFRTWLQNAVASARLSIGLSIDYDIEWLEDSKPSPDTFFEDEEDNQFL